MPFSQVDEQEAIHERVTRLVSIRGHPEDCKLGRWFSWNSCAHAYLPEFSAVKMVLGDYLDGSGIQDPDTNSIPFDDLQGLAKAKNPRAQLAQLKKNGGGLQLMYRLMSSALWQLCMELKIATKAFWDFYTWLTKKVKTPVQGLVFTMKMADSGGANANAYASAKEAGGWRSIDHLGETFRISLNSCDNLDEMWLGPRFEGHGDQVKRMSRLVSLSLSLVSGQAWSMAARHSRPPECWANALSAARVKRNLVVEAMRLQHGNVKALEVRRHTDPLAKELWLDLRGVVESMPIRVILAQYERDNFSEDCVAGSKLLRGTLQTTPTNKATEELHHYLRMNVRGNANLKQTVVRKQVCVLSSGVLEAHQYSHKCRVDKAYFTRHWANKKTLRRKRGNHCAWRHKLPAEMSKIMGAKTWSTTSEAADRRLAAAWQCLQFVGPAGTHQGHPVSLSSTLFSQLLQPLMLFYFECEEGVPVWASLGSEKWAALAWPMEKVASVGASSCYLFPWSRGGVVPKVQTFHITDPRLWSVVRWRPAYLPGVADHGGCLVLESVGVESLPKAALRHSKLLGFVVLQQLALLLLGAAVNVNTLSRSDLLAALASHLAPSDDEYLEAVLNPSVEDPLNYMVDDPLFEATFDELSPEDRKELNKVKDALDEKKVGVHHATRNCKRDRRGRLLTPKAKAKPKAKAVAAGSVAAGAVAAPPVVPPAAAVVVPPPQLPAVPPVALPAQPDAAVPAPLGDGKYPGGYLHIGVPGGDLVYSSVLGKINAHCLHAAHQTTKCHMDRSIPIEYCASNKCKGRPLGLLALWLKYTHGPDQLHSDKDTHTVLKKILPTAAYYDERKQARSDLWGMRGEKPQLLEIFACEQVPPASYVGEGELYEPLCVF